MVVIYLCKSGRPITFFMCYFGMLFAFWSDSRFLCSRFPLRRPTPKVWVPSFVPHGWQDQTTSEKQGGRTACALPFAAMSDKVPIIKFHFVKKFSTVGITTNIGEITRYREKFHVSNKDILLKTVPGRTLRAYSGWTPSTPRRFRFQCQFHHSIE